MENDGNREPDLPEKVVHLLVVEIFKTKRFRIGGQDVRTVVLEGKSEVLAGGGIANEFLDVIVVVAQLKGMPEKIHQSLLDGGKGTGTHYINLPSKAHRNPSSGS
jgi:hypothetical protein